MARSPRRQTDQASDNTEAAEYIALEPVAENSELPPRVRLLRPFGFITDDGRHHLWQVHNIVSDASVVASLIDRGAPVEHLEG